MLEAEGVSMTPHDIDEINEHRINGAREQMMINLFVNNKREFAFREDSEQVEFATGVIVYDTNRKKYIVA